MQTAEQAATSAVKMTLKRGQLPLKFAPMFRPMRFKALWGGRGGAKSHTIAEALVVAAAGRPLRILCARETQKSIKESSKKLLEIKIEKLGLSKFFTITLTEIRGLNGSVFLFEGLRTNPEAIKSMEGIDIVWVEEANTVSQRSLDLLVPTIRAPGSELWFSWNPRSPKDPVDKMFRGENGPPPRAFVQRVGWQDNPWFPDELRDEMEWTKRRDPDKYAHVWLGEYAKSSEARVFKNWRIDSVDVPEDCRPYYGGDWGFSVDPTVLVRMWHIPEKRLIYIDAEAWKVSCTIDNTPALFAGSDTKDPPRWPNPYGWEGIEGAHEWPIVADSARPETIKHLRDREFNIRGARKGPGSVEDGVEFLKSHDIVVHQDCKHVIDELTLYSYEIDKLTEEVLPKLADKKNHTIDSCRYALEGVRRAKNHSNSIGDPSQLGFQRPSVIY